MNVHTNPTTASDRNFKMECTILDLWTLAVAMEHLKQELGPTEIEGHVAVLAGMMCDNIYELQKCWNSRGTPPEHRKGGEK